MTCNRMVIMYEGKILAADTSQNLHGKMRGKGQVIAEIAAPLAALQECWAQMPEVAHFDVSPGQGDYVRCSLIPENGTDLRPVIFSLVRERGWTLRELTRSGSTLEDIYVQITKPTEEEEA